MDKNTKTNKCSYPDDCSCDYCDDDVLIDEPIDSKPTAKYRQWRKIVGCTCGKARIATGWTLVEGDDVLGVNSDDGKQTKLKRKLKKKKAEFNQVWDDYQSLGLDWSGHVMLYHDMIKLLSEFDNDLLLRAVRAADLRRIEKLKAELKDTNDERRSWMRSCSSLRRECNGLKAEIAQLKAPKLQVSWNGDPFETVSVADDNTK